MEEAVRAAVQALGYGVTASRRMPGGSGLPTWQVTTPGGAFAVRLYPASLAWAAWGMARLGTALGSAGFPVAAAVAVVESLPDHVALVQEWLPGVTCGEALRGAPEQARGWGVQFGQMQARLHALPVPPEAGSGVPQLETGLPAPARPVWLHLDYHPLNVLVDGGRVSAVLDWENVHLGDARADVARTLSLLSVDPGLRGAGPDVRRTLGVFRRGYLAGYREGSGGACTTPAFLAWAGEFMLRDQAQRRGAAELAPVQRWSRYWRSRLPA